MRLTLDQLWPRLLQRTVGRAGLLPRINLHVPVSMSQGSVQVPYLRGQAVDLSAERWMSSLLEQLLPSWPGTFVDVGVNLGQTLIKTKLVERGRRIVGFEPNPLCVAYIRELAKANHFENVEIIPTGLFTSDAILSLDLFGGDVDSAASLISGFRPGERIRDHLNVPVVRWETAARAIEVGRVGLVKIDVEGAELEVLTTMQAVLETARPVVILEVLPTYSGSNPARVERQAQLVDLFRRNRYEVFRIHKSQADDLVSLEKTRDFGSHSDLTHCDYVMFPAERAGEASSVRAAGHRHQAAGR